MRNQAAPQALDLLNQIKVSKEHVRSGGRGSVSLKKCLPDGFETEVLG